MALQESSDKLASDVAMELQQRHMNTYDVIGGEYASIIYNKHRLRCTGESFRYFKRASDKRPIVSASFKMGQGKAVAHGGPLHAEHQRRGLHGRERPPVLGANAPSLHRAGMRVPDMFGDRRRHHGDASVET